MDNSRRNSVWPVCLSDRQGNEGVAASTIFLNQIAENQSGKLSTSTALDSL